MVDRINVILKSKNITSSQLAEKIGIQPSGMSHILNGRNNPSLDFVKKVLVAYPEISPDWMLFGNGEMLRSAETAKIPENKEVNVSLDSQLSENKQVVSQQAELFMQNSMNIPDIPPEQSLSQMFFSDSDTAENETVANSSKAQLSEIEHVKKKYEPAEISINESAPHSESKNAVLVEKKVERFLVLFSDHTFTEYTRNSD